MKKQTSLFITSLTIVIALLLGSMVDIGRMTSSIPSSILSAYAYNAVSKVDRLSVEVRSPVVSQTSTNCIISRGNECVKADFTAL